MTPSPLSREASTLTEAELDELARLPGRLENVKYGARPLCLKSAEAIRKLVAAARAHLSAGGWREEVRKFLRAFVQQPDLEDMAADGVTVAQVYQKQAAALLKLLPPTPSGEEQKEARPVTAYWKADGTQEIVEHPPPQGDVGEETCPHGRPLHQDCFACDESSPSPTQGNAIEGLVEGLLDPEYGIADMPLIREAATALLAQQGEVERWKLQSLDRDRLSNQLTAAQERITRLVGLLGEASERLLKSGWDTHSTIIERIRAALTGREA